MDTYKGYISDINASSTSMRACLANCLRSVYFSATCTQRKLNVLFEKTNTKS
jgi:hypothetical protein